MERHGMPVLRSEKLRFLWDKLKQELGNNFDEELFAALPKMELNQAIVHLCDKYNIVI